LEYPIESIACKDPNGRIQLVAFGFLSGKDKEAFEDFFKKFKEMAYRERSKAGINGTIGNIILCDRCKAQKCGIIQSFQNSKIIYCKVHIMRNIKNMLGPKSALAKLSQEMFKYRTKEYEDNSRIKKSR